MMHAMSRPGDATRSTSAAGPTADTVLQEAERALQASRRVDHPHAGKERWDAGQLLAFALGEELNGELDPDRKVPATDLRRFRRLLARRELGEPVAYLTRRAPFMDLSLEVGPGAFIPRESSEWMAVQAARRLRSRRSPVHVDLATGVGPVALAVARSVPRARVFGADLSARPVALARRNAQRLGLANATFVQGDLFAPLPSSLRGEVDVITIHPPYVGRREVRTLPHEIKGFEPIESLTDNSPEGLGLLGRTTALAPGWLRPGGWLLVEVSPDRARAVAAVLRRAGFGEVRSTKGGLPVSRVIVGRAVR
jgi:release factor glutamine methyltransferase